MILVAATRRLMAADALELTYSIIPEAALVEPQLIVVDTTEVAIVDDIPDSTVTEEPTANTGDTPSTPTDGTPAAPTTPVTPAKTSTGFSSSSSDAEDFSSFLTSLATLQESIQTIVSVGLPPMEINGLTIEIDQQSLVLAVEAPTAAVCSSSCKVRHKFAEWSIFQIVLRILLEARMPNALIIGILLGYGTLLL